MDLSELPESGTGALGLDLSRRLLAEAVGTCLLMVAVVGSAIMASTLSDEPGIQLLAISVAVGAALLALIYTFGGVSGAHFNPAVTLLDRLFGTISSREASLYVMAQLTGGILGTIIANLMFEYPAVEFSSRVRSSPGLWLGEFIATLGLLLVIHGCVRTGRANVVAVAIAAWIAGAHWFTSSTSFANPAVTVSRMFTDTFNGISPSSVSMFVVMQLLAVPAAWVLVKFIFAGSEEVLGNGDPSNG